MHREILLTCPVDEGPKAHKLFRLQLIILLFIPSMAVMEMGLLI
jgi:hypothetical protein